MCVVERLDKVGLYNQFNDLKVVCNCIFQDSELGTILKPWVIINYLSLLKKILKATVIVTKLDCHIIFDLDTNILIIQVVMHRNIVLLSVTITTIEIVLSNGRDSNFFKIKELLIKSAILSLRVLLENCIIIYILVNVKLMVQELKYP